MRVLILATAMFLVVALSSCARTEQKSDGNSTVTNGTATIPADAPSIIGVVTSIGPGRTLRIEEKPSDESGSAKAVVRVPEGVAIRDRDSNTPRTFEDLQQGATVSAWFTGPVAESYPVQATASALVIERTAPNDSATTILNVDPKGFGPVRVGMTTAEAASALGAELKLLGPEMQPCHYVQATERPGVAFMVIDGRIARVDVRPDSPIRTAEGAAVGDSEERIHSLYPGRVEVQPHKYVDGHYLIVRPAAPSDSTYRIIFDTDGKKVTGYKAGRMPEVRWVEGCS